MPAHRPIFKPGGVSKTKGRTVSGLYFHHQRGWQRIVLPGAGSAGRFLGGAVAAGQRFAQTAAGRQHETISDNSNPD